MILDVVFLRAFGLLLIEVLFLAASGGLLGAVLASIFIRSVWLSQHISDIFKYASWVPFFIFFALPLQPDNVLTATLITGISAVSLYTCSYILSLRIIHGASWHGFINEAGKASILQALLFSLFSQVHSQIGWIRLFIQRPSAGLIYSAIVLLIIFLFLVDRVFRSTFDGTARAYGAIFRTELVTNSWALFCATILLSFVCLFWRVAIDERETVWRDLFVSTVEIWGGVLVSGGLSLVLSRVLASDSMLTRLFLSIISITSIIPIIFPMLLPLVGINRIGELSLSTTISIACLTFYPFLRALWAVRDQQRPARILLAVKDVLPFAFVGMLFGELYGAVAGLGFRITSEQASADTAEAVFISLETFLVFVLLALILRNFCAWLRLSHFGVNNA